MAGATVFTIKSIMLVIFPMARDAFRFELLFEFVLDMTVGAGDITVCTGQCKRCLGRVIEKGFSPGTADMTERAIGSVQALVRIVIAVTGVTLGRRIQIIRFNVAGRTLDPEMAADQRVTGLGGVIELDFTPTGLDMTGRTLLAEPTLMLIVLRMAIETE
jgi:hypothetical protein